jgi:hypothetical protein
MCILAPDDRERLIDQADRRAGGGIKAELLRLAAIYERDKDELGDPPRSAQLRDGFAEGRRAAAATRAAIRLTPWARRELEAGPGLPALEGLDERLAEVEQKFRCCELDLSDRIRQRPDRRPGSPRWHFTWALCGLWERSGRLVGVGDGTPFLEFASTMFSAVAEVSSERHIREVAAKWQARPDAPAQKAA